MNEQPLFWGRLLRILLGLALCAWLFVRPHSGLVLQAILLFFGLSLVIGGIKAYAGCEIMAIPNLLSGKRLQCY